MIILSRWYADTDRALETSLATHFLLLDTRLRTSNEDLWCVSSVMGDEMR